jgi:type II secretion system protein C
MSSKSKNFLKLILSKILRKSSDATQNNTDDSLQSYDKDFENQSPPQKIPPISKSTKNENQIDKTLEQNIYDDQDEFNREISRPLSIKEKLDQAAIRLQDIKTKWFSRKFQANLSLNSSPVITNNKRKQNLILLQYIFEKLKFYNWERLSDDLLHPKQKRKIHYSFLVILILIIPFQLGKITALFLTPKTSPNFKLTQINFNKEKVLDQAQLLAIKNASLFKTEIKEVTPTQTEKKPTAPEFCDSATQISKLRIKILSTTVLQNNKKSMASLLINEKDPLEARIGDDLNGLAILGAIEPWRIIFKNKQTLECEFLEGNPTSPRAENKIAVLSKKESANFLANKKIDGIENDGNTFKIKKDFLKSKLGNLNEILTQARGIPINNPDGTMSFKVVDIEAGGVFSHLGIQNNDIITQINGQKINSINEVMNLFGKITNLSKLQITVNRAGEETPLDYNLQ